MKAAQNIVHVEEGEGEAPIPPKYDFEEMI